MGGVDKRFWFALAGLVLFAAYTTQKLVRVHVRPVGASNRYEFTRPLRANRGSIFDAKGRTLAISTPIWSYHLDSVQLTNRVVKPKGEKVPRTRKAIARTISNVLGLDYAKVLAMSENDRNLYQPLGESADSGTYRLLADSSMVSGVVIEDHQIRQYPQGRLMSHVLGAINAEDDGTAGIELKYDTQMKGLPGEIRGLKDARGYELYDRRKMSVDPVRGTDIHLTVDRSLQFAAEKFLAEGIREFGAGSGWCIVMDAKSAAILAMASRPDFDPLKFGRASPEATKNRAIGFNYEPGSVMKVITAAAAIDSGRATPRTVYLTRRDDPRYYRLPGDGSHKWEPTMTVRDAIVHSSNIVIGKLGVDLGRERLWKYMKAFGFGAKTGVELPGEETGILHNWKNWDKASWSRVPIGQAVSVTGIQLVSAYQAIANDGVRMQPYIVAKTVDGHGTVTEHEGRVLGRPIRPETARTVREMMLDVASKNGTARRARIPGYSVAGKTGTAQKAVGGTYAPGLYRASFCGIVPASEPRFVILVTLDFDAKTRYHQGGNSSGVVFRKLAKVALRYFEVPPDKPDEQDELNEDDEVDRLMDDLSGT